MKVTYASVADNQKAVMAATGTYTAFILNASTAATASYAFHYGDKCYLNNRSNKLATWNDTRGANDGGSSFLFTEVSDEPLPNELTITVDKPNGTLYNGSGGTTGNYFSTWKSASRPQVTFGCGTTNNMNWSGNNLQLFTGSAASFRSIFRIYLIAVICSTSVQSLFLISLYRRGLCQCKGVDFCQLMYGTDKTAPDELLHQISERRFKSSLWLSQISVISCCRSLISSA